MGARVVKLTCANPACAKPFKAEHKQAKQATACCSYECEHWRRYGARREAVIASWRHLPYDARRRAHAWLTTS